MDEAGATAILSLQSDACLEALRIDYPSLHARACARGLVAARVAVRDFDHNDQAAMLPEAVRMLHALTALGHRVYVHCTAGINRATLTTVGYLTFVRGWGLEDALAAVCAARPQAHPYVDCWRTVRRRLLEGRGEEITLLAREAFREREQRGDGGSSKSDWEQAEVALIRRTFARQTEATLTLVTSMSKIGEAREAAAQEAARREALAQAALAQEEAVGKVTAAHEAALAQALAARDDALAQAAAAEVRAPSAAANPAPAASAALAPAAAKPEKVEDPRILEAVGIAEKELLALSAVLRKLAVTSKALAASVADGKAY